MADTDTGKKYRYALEFQTVSVDRYEADYPALESH